MDSEIQKIIFGFVACFFFVMVAVTSFAQNENYHPSVIASKIDLPGILENPGPHKICVGCSAPSPKVKGTYIASKGGCSYSPKIFYTPNLPEIFNTPGTYTYEIKVKGIPDIFLSSHPEACPVLDQEKIGDFKVIVKSGSCCDQCNGDEKFDLADVYLTNWWNRVSPTDFRTYEELLNFVTVKSVGWAVKVITGSTGNLNYLEKFVIEKFVNYLIPDRPYEEIFKAIDKIDKNLMRSYGARIWIQFKRKECIEKTCLSLSKKKVWHYYQASVFFPCSIGGQESDFGLGVGRSSADAAREVEEAIPLCIEEARKKRAF